MDPVNFDKQQPVRGVIWDVSQGGRGPRFRGGDLVIDRGPWAVATGILVLILSLLGLPRGAHANTPASSAAGDHRFDATAGHGRVYVAAAEGESGSCTHADKHIDHTITGAGDGQEHHLDSHVDNGC